MVEPREFSIVIPTFGRPDKLRACLEALTRLVYPRDRFEVVVVDDGGDVALEPVVAAVQGRVDVTLLRVPHGGAAAARNRGAARARGRFLAFMDDDCAPAPDWLDKLERRFAPARASVMIGGRTINVLTGNVYSAASQLVMDAGYAHLNGDPERAHFVAACNLAVPAEAFRGLGGFDESFVTSEDRELCGRWESRGHRIIYAPEAIVYHAHDLTLASFWRQHFAYGRGAFLMQRARTRHGWEQFRPDPGYYARLLRTPFSGTPRVAAVRLAALLLVSQSAGAAGLIAEWARQRRVAAA